MAYSVTPTSGIDLGSLVNTNLNSAGVAIPTVGPLGLQVFGSDGKRYVLAVAGATIAASTAVAAVSPSTFIATATGGTYLSPAVSVPTGSYAWFAEASV
jgi:hypothetical protein